MSNTSNLYLELDGCGAVWYGTHVGTKKFWGVCTAYTECEKVDYLYYSHYTGPYTSYDDYTTVILY